MHIHPQIEKDSHFIADLGLSQLRLLPDGENPWFLLIPKQVGLVDWCDLSQQQQYQLSDEINLLCHLLKREAKPDKLNIGSLGNKVAQLHIHIIARYKSDRAWPDAIWGTQSTKNFKLSSIEEWKNLISQQKFE